MFIHSSRGGRGLASPAGQASAAASDPNSSSSRQLLSLRSLDLAGPRLRIRRLVLGPFRSALNPIGVMGAGFVAREILRQVSWNCGLVIVTPNPLTYVLMPLTTLSRWLYFRACSQAQN